MCRALSCQIPDRTQPDDLPARTARLQDKLGKLRRQMNDLREVEQQLQQQPDQQISQTDPDARSMATSGRGTGIVGYNVQIATVWRLATNSECPPQARAA